MKKHRILFTGLSVLCGAAVLSQTLPSSLPSKGPRSYGVPGSAGEAQFFNLGGKRHRAAISYQEIAAGPDWRPSMPLPLSPTRAEEIARTELGRWLPDNAGWEVTDLHFKRLRGNDEPKWYCAVRMAPTVRNASSPDDSFLVLINFAGTPGPVELHAETASR